MTSRATRSTRETSSEFVPRDPVRREFLDRNAASTGLHWSVAIRNSLQRQGRPASGGFPGTMSEVRAHVASMLGTALANARMSALLPEEREWSARVAYAAARKDWLAHGVRADEEDDTSEADD